MKSSEIRSISRQNLDGKWGKTVLATLIFLLITFTLSFALALIPIIGPITSTIISVPLSFGFLITLSKLNNNQEIHYLDFLNDGFALFGKVWGVTLHIFLKLILPVIFVIVSIILNAFAIFNHSAQLLTLTSILYIASIIYVAYKSFLYTFSLHVLIDNPEISGKDAVEKSAELMRGNIWKYICLNLSFIGWVLVCFLSNFIIPLVPFLVGILFLLPYIKIAEINFYKHIDGQI